jgi:hypothetical protein
MTDPKQRATMSEVMNHPWMLKGYHGPPENYLPYREALSLPLDPNVIEGMTGFGFGSFDEIQHKLTRIIESRKYQEAVGRMEKDREIPQPATKDAEKKSGFGFFYKRRNSVTSKDTLTTSTDGLPLGLDPLNAFHPMVSIYYLVRERQERERTDPQTPPKVQPPSSPQEPVKPPVPTIQRPKEKHSLVEITPPQPAHTDARSRQRTRSHSEDQAREPVKNGLLSPDVIPAKKEGNVAGLLRRLSTRTPRKKDALDPEAGGMARGAMSMKTSKSLGNARRESIQARRAKREAEAREQQQQQQTQQRAPLKEETDAELDREVEAVEADDSAGASNERLDSRGPDLAKPVFLRGIFSVSTTSTKPLPEIRADIKRVLKQLGVGYAEIKGGFNCTHSPSITVDRERDHRDRERREREKERDRDLDEPSSSLGGPSSAPGGEIRFEILIVKVPIVSLHGVQFKRVGGDTWQYKNMAEQIVRELRL